MSQKGYSNYVHVINTGMKDVINFSLEAGRGLSCSEVRDNVLASLGEHYTEVDVPPPGTIKNTLENHYLSGGFARKRKRRNENSYTFRMEDAGKNLVLPSSNNMTFAAKNRRRGLAPFMAYGHAHDDSGENHPPTSIKETILGEIYEEGGMESDELFSKMNRDDMLNGPQNKRKKFRRHMEFLTKSEGGFRPLIKGYDPEKNGFIRLTGDGNKLVEGVVIPNNLFFWGDTGTCKRFEKSYQKVMDGDTGKYFRTAISAYMPLSPKGKPCDENDIRMKKTLLDVMKDRGKSDVITMMVEMGGADEGKVRKWLNDFAKAGVLERSYKKDPLEAGMNHFIYELV